MGQALPRTQGVRLLYALPIVELGQLQEQEQEQEPELPQIETKAAKRKTCVPNVCSHPGSPGNKEKEGALRKVLR